MPYEITQCYLPPGRGDFPAFTPAEAGTRGGTRHCPDDIRTRGTVIQQRSPSRLAMKCKVYGKLILRKIIEIIATRKGKKGKGRGKEGKEAERRGKE